MSVYAENDVPHQNGKTFFITGANTGIGYEAARVLAQRGGRVLLGCRIENKAHEALSKIRALAPDADVAWVPLDLTDLNSVRAAAEQVMDEPRLDVLINNAGVMVPPRQETKDGFELQFGVNHLGHFALTQHLLDKLKQTAASRIVTVSSNAHRGGRIDYDDIHARVRYSRFGRYQMSKFANILFMYELQRRLERDQADCISVACHPGGSTTELGRHIPPYLAVMFLPLSLIMNTAAEGALPTLMAATQEGVRGAEYFGPMRWGEMAHSAHRVQTDRASRDEQDAARLWTLSEELTGVAAAL